MKKRISNIEHGISNIEVVVPGNENQYEEPWRSHKMLVEEHKMRDLNCGVATKQIWKEKNEKMNIEYRTQNIEYRS